VENPFFVGAQFSGIEKIFKKKPFFLKKHLTIAEK